MCCEWWVYSCVIMSISSCNNFETAHICCFVFFLSQTQLRNAFILKCVCVCERRCNVCTFYSPVEDVLVVVLLLLVV